jgi:uncharacterized protein YxjI
MSILHPDFYAGTDFFIDEKVGMFKLTNEYKIYNGKGEQIGRIKQQRSGSGGFLQFILNKKMLPFKLEIFNAQDQLQASISRGWTFWMSKISLVDANNVKLGNIKQKFKLFSTKFHLEDDAGNQLAEINGDWKAWNFSIADMGGMPLGRITKKWAGVAKEFFTTADKYIVSVDKPHATKQEKLTVLTVAITIDMVLKESK